MRKAKEHGDVRADLLARPPSTISGAGGPGFCASYQTTSERSQIEITIRRPQGSPRHPWVQLQRRNVPAEELEHVFEAVYCDSAEIHRNLENPRNAA